MKYLLEHANRHGYGVGAFDIVSLEFLAAAVGAAEACRAPVVLSVAEPHADHVDPESLLPAVESRARRARVPVAIQFHHARSVPSGIRAIALGCGSVTLDGAHGALAERSAAARAMVEMAHACGVPVEGGLNAILRDSEPEADAVSVETAQEFVAHTGIDFLAIADAPRSAARRPRIDFKRLAQLRSSVSVPLTVDGNHRFSDEEYRHLIESGVAKLGYYAGLSGVAARTLRQSAGATHQNGYLRLMRDLPEALHREVERCLRLSGSAGRADAALAHCRPVRTVEHCIVYNVVEGAAEREVAGMMEKGREVLGRIPGVRGVFAGRAVQADGRYRYCWRIVFANAAVIDRYREHPDHVAFADGRFRPLAPDRLSIDFEEIP